MTFHHHVQAALSELEQAGLRRKARDIQGPQGPRIIVDGRPALCLCSNNYLGLANHPLLSGALRRSLDEDGVGSGASRLISGSMAAHRDAEQALAAYVQQPAAALFSTGYACNLGVVQALVGRDDIIFSDALNHASIIDGARLSRARIVVYEHASPGDLAAKLKAHRAQGRAALVISESLFSMDGDQAPLPELARLAREHQAGFMVDEAHALGVLGPQGRGLCAALGLVPDVVVGTLGKALGGQGAFVASSEPVVDLVRNRARSYVFSTAPAPALARVALLAVRLATEADPLRERLRGHAIRLRSALRELGYQVLPGESPIIPVMVGEPGPTMQLSQTLLEHGVFAHGIRPPTVPAGTGRLRVVPMASHSDADIEEAIAAFKAVRP